MARGRGEHGYGPGLHRYYRPGARLDGKVSEADGGEGVKGEVKSVEVSPVIVVETEGDRVAGLVRGLGLGLGQSMLVRVARVRAKPDLQQRPHGECEQRAHAALLRRRPAAEALHQVPEQHHT